MVVQQWLDSLQQLDLIWQLVKLSLEYGESIFDVH